MNRNVAIAVGVGCGTFGLLFGSAGILAAVVFWRGGQDPAPAAGSSTGSAPAAVGVFERLISQGPPPPEVAIRADECEAVTSPPPTNDCITGEIRCDEVVRGHTNGGVRRFDTEFYRRQFCTPDTTDHNGGEERIYRLVMPKGEWHAEVWLDTPCADLDLAAMRWQGSTCPAPGASLAQCDMWPRNGTEREHVQLVSQTESEWLLVVEGKGKEEGAFALHVQCFPGLH